MRMNDLRPASPAWAVLVLPMGLLAGPPTALAQAALEEIVVTAQKRLQSLQNAPIAITAFGADGLKQKGIEGLEDIGSFAPNVKVTPTPSNSTAATVAIRGSVTVNPAITWEPTVGIYLDGVFIGKNLGSIFDVAELERVEILRGPQGTLYGKNTIGGAVNLITQEPAGEFGGNIRLGYGNFEYRDVYAAIDTPTLELGVAGKVMAKFTGGIKKRDGFYDNVPTTLGAITNPLMPAAGPTVEPNPPSNSETNSLDSEVARADILWDVTDRLSLRYAYDYIDIENDPPKMQLTAIDPSVNVLGLPVPADLAKYLTEIDENLDKTSLDTNYFESSRSRSHSLFANYDIGDLGSLGDVTLRYIGNNRTLDWNNSIDNDGTPFNLFWTGRFVDYEQNSHEIQIVGSTARIDYVFGLFYFEEEADAHDPQHPLNAFFGPMVIDNRYGFDNTQRAAYGQIDWRPSSGWLEERLVLTFGLRYTMEDKDVYIDHPAPRIGGVVQPAAPETVYQAQTDGDWENLSPTLVASYEFTGSLNAYIKYSQGWKSGGFNGESPQAQFFVGGYEPEEVKAYEIGLKSRWLEDRLQFNAAAFLNRIDDMQLTIFLSGATSASVVRNAGEATVNGFEFELLYKPMPALQLSMNYGYLDAEYDEFLEPDATGVLVDKSDQKDFPYTPRHTVNLGIDYTIFDASGWGTLVGHLDYSYVDDYVPYINPDQNATSMIDGYGLFNGRLSLRDIPVGDQRRLEVALWGKNLGDEEYRTSTIPFGSWTHSYYGDPRSYGLEVIYSF